MKIDLGADSEEKLDELLEVMSTRYNLQELTVEELLDALLDLGLDVMSDYASPAPVEQARLVNYCGGKIKARHY